MADAWSGAWGTSWGAAWGGAIKGTPASGDRFTERSPNGVMGIPYTFTAKGVIITAGIKKHRGFLRNVGRLMK